MAPATTSGNEAAISVPRLERSTTRPASTQTSALNPSHFSYALLVCPSVASRDENGSRLANGVKRRIFLLSAGALGSPTVADYQDVQGGTVRELCAVVAGSFVVGCGWLGCGVRVGGGAGEFRDADGCCGAGRGRGSARVVTGKPGGSSGRSRRSRTRPGRGRCWPATGVSKVEDACGCGRRAVLLPGGAYAEPYGQL